MTLKLSFPYADRDFAVFTTICFIFSMNVGQRIRSLRREKRLTQQQLGDLIGKTQQEIYRWEKGVVRIHADDLGLIAKALGVPSTAFYEDLDFANIEVDWELQDATRRMTAKQRQKLIEYLNTINDPETSSAAPLVENTEEVAP